MSLEDLIREAPVGQALRWLTNDSILLYPEERSDFIIPKEWFHGKSVASLSSKSTVSLDSNAAHNESVKIIRPLEDADMEDASSRIILVDWYSEDDTANPLNWSKGKKFLITTVICLYTFVVYLASSVYVSSEAGVRAAFSVSTQQASLPLSIFVLGYGLGPMLFAPLSEMACVGRNRVYAWTFLIFVVISIPTTLVKSFGGFVALRFFQAFFGSPCLANGGASIQDIYSEYSVPFGLSVWVSATSIGPSVGPILSGFAVNVTNWRLSLREVLWLAAPIGICLNLFLAETSAPTILLRRAQRIRKVTSCDCFRSYSEIYERGLSPRAIAFAGLIKPVQIACQDPVVAFTIIYTSLMYGIYYSFFEVFPLVFADMYNFTVGEQGLVFICIIIASCIGALSYMSYVYFFLNPHLRRDGPKSQEYRLRPALVGCFLPPVGLLVFGWTANVRIHWIVCIIGLVIYTIGVFVTLQCISIYIPRTYPHFSASLFAGNELVRSMVATGSIHFAAPLYTNLHVNGGVSLLAGLSTLGIAGMYFLYFCGGRMRKKSKFAVSGIHFSVGRAGV